MINGLFEGMVCVKGCNTENDKWFVWLSCLCEGMVCVWTLWSDTIQTICNTQKDKWLILHIFWFVWRDGLCEGMVFVKGLFVSLHRDHKSPQSRQYIIQRRVNGLYYILSGLCEGMVCVKGWLVWRDGLCITYCLLCVKAWTQLNRPTQQCCSPIVS